VVNAAPNYAGQLCYATVEMCNAVSPCAYMDPPQNCTSSVNSSLTTCSSGPSNLNTSNFVNQSVYVNYADQFVCDAVNVLNVTGNITFGAIPGASGLLCYPDVDSCNNSPLNPCSPSTPCLPDPTWCGSGMALAFSNSSGGASNQFACTALQVPTGAVPQGNEFMCFDTQAHCEADPNSGCSPNGVTYSAVNRKVVFNSSNAQLPQTYRCVNDTAFCAGGLTRSLAPWVCPTSYQLNSAPTADGILCYKDANSCAVSGANSCWGNSSGLPSCAQGLALCAGVQGQGYTWGCSIGTLSSFISSPPYVPGPYRLALLQARILA